MVHPKPRGQRWVVSVKLGLKPCFIYCPEQVFSVQCSVFSVQCSVFSVQCSVFSVRRKEVWDASCGIGDVCSGFSIAIHALRDQIKDIRIQ
jgi:hypothetical protein